MLTLIGRQVRDTLGTLREIRGNARAMLFAETMWAIPFNLYTAYSSLFMLGLGCSERQVGLAMSVNLLCGVFFSLSSGFVTDRLGRRRTTLLFDTIAWSIPTLLWAFARSFAWFLAAAIVNSVVRIVYTSWTCLLVEDTEPRLRVYVYSWLNIVGLLAGFFAPLAGLLVRRYSVVPTMRGLYLLSFLSFTSMFFLRNAHVRETGVGRKRMQTVRALPARKLAGNVSSAVLLCARDPLVLIAILLLVINNIQITIRTTFFSILIAGDLGFMQAEVALFPAIYSAVMLLAYLLLMPLVGRMRVEPALGLSFGCTIAGYLLLVVTPPRSYLLVTLSTTLSALGATVAGPVLESLVANSISDEERASVMSVLFALILAVTSPFGYIGGVLSSVSDRFPFVLALGSSLANLVLVGLLRSVKARRAGAGAAGGSS